MFDSNENKSKGDKTFEEWVKTYPVDFKKQILPNITEFSRFVEFVDLRWEMLKERLKQALRF